LSTLQTIRIAHRGAIARSDAQLRSTKTFFVSV